MIGDSPRGRDDGMAPGQAPLEGSQVLEVPQAAGRTATEAAAEKEVDYEAEFKRLREQKKQWANIIGEEFGTVYSGDGDKRIPNWGMFNGISDSANGKVSWEKATGEETEPLTDLEKIALAAQEKNRQIIFNFRDLKASLLKKQEKSGVDSPVLPYEWDHSVGINSGDIKEVEIDPYWKAGEDDLERRENEGRGMTRARIKKEFGIGGTDDNGFEGFITALSSAEQRQRHNKEKPNDKWNLLPKEELALDIRREEKSRDAEDREAREMLAAKRRAAKGDPIERLGKI